MGVSSYDVATNYVVCTSATRPSGDNVHEGTLIFETDTNFVMVYDGAAWHGTNVARVPFCSVYRNAALSVTTGGSGILLAFDGTLLDTLGINASGVFTIPAGWSGAWLMAAGASFPFNSVGRRAIQFSINGAAVHNLTYAAPISATHPLAATGSMIIPNLVAGDEIRLYGYQDSGASLALNVGNSTSTYAKFIYLGWT